MKNKECQIRAERSRCRLADRYVTRRSHGNCKIVRSPERREGEEEEVEEEEAAGRRGRKKAATTCLNSSAGFCRGRSARGAIKDACNLNVLSMHVSIRRSSREREREKRKKLEDGWGSFVARDRRAGGLVFMETRENGAAAGGGGRRRPRRREESRKSRQKLNPLRRDLAGTIKSCAANERFPGCDRRRPNDSRIDR